MGIVEKNYCCWLLLQTKKKSEQGMVTAQ